MNQDCSYARLYKELRYLLEFMSHDSTSTTIHIGLYDKALSILSCAIGGVYLCSQSLSYSTSIMRHILNISHRYHLPNTYISLPQVSSTNSRPFASHSNKTYEINHQYHKHNVNHRSRPTSLHPSSPHLPRRQRDNHRRKDKEHPRCKQQLRRPARVLQHHRQVPRR